MRLKVPKPEETPNSKPANSLNSTPAQKRIQPDEQHVSGYKESNQGEHHDVSKTDVHLINCSPQNSFVPTQGCEEVALCEQLQGRPAYKESSRQRVAQALASVDLRICEALLERCLGRMVNGDMFTLIPALAGTSVHMVSFPVQRHRQLHPLDPSKVRQPRTYEHSCEIRLYRTSGHFQFFGDFSLITPQQQQLRDLLLP